MRNGLSRQPISLALLGMIGMCLFCCVPGGAVEQTKSPGALLVGAPVQVTMGNDVGYQVIPFADAAHALDDVAAGGSTAQVGAFEPYVKWMLLEPKEGKWDFRYYDMVVEKMTRHGLKWVPFLIAGPAYATPKWFKESKASVFAKCLEHGETTRTQSIWNPNLPAHVEQFVRAFAAHYDHKQMQSVLLGISGDFGESIYTEGGNEWTYRWDGEYHHHLGWWCGDDYAVKDFRAAMTRKYRTIAALNRAWGADYASFTAVRPFIPTDGNRRARLDMTHWYCDSMTRYAESWLRIIRKYLPDVEVTLALGGNAQPQLGADITAQAVMAAKYHCGLRLTMEGDDYLAGFTMTRYARSACANLGSYLGFEPGGNVSDDGVVSRIFNNVGSGADELFIYDNPPYGARAAIYDKYRPLLAHKRVPALPIAVFVPMTSHFAQVTRTLFPRATAFRFYTDYDFMDETLIAQGFLDRYKVLVWVDAPVTERATLQKIATWVKRGGKLYCQVKPETVEGEPWTDRLSKYPTAHLWPLTDLDAFYQQVVAAEKPLFPHPKAEGVYWTHFTDGSAMVLNYTHQPYTEGNLTVPPISIVEVEK